MSKRTEIFDAPRKPVRLLLPVALLEELEAVAEIGYASRSVLVAEIIRQWFKRPDGRKALKPDWFSLVNVPEETRRKIEFKKMILDQWRAARALDRRRKGVAHVTTAFLARIEREHGVSISRSSLFNWDARFRQHGLMGLADYRGDKVALKALQKSIEGGEKNAAKVA